MGKNWGFPTQEGKKLSFPCVDSPSGYRENGISGPLTGRQHRGAPLLPVHSDQSSWEQCPWDTVDPTTFIQKELQYTVPQTPLQSVLSIGATLFRPVLSVSLAGAWQDPEQSTLQKHPRRALIPVWPPPHSCSSQGFFISPHPDAPFSPPTLGL